MNKIIATYNKRFFFAINLATLLVVVAMIITIAMAQQVLAENIQTAPVNTEVNNFLSADEIMKKHAEAIVIGKDEFYEGVTKDPKLAGLEDSDYKEYRDVVLGNFFRGKDSGTMGEIVKYSPNFTTYILAFANDFPLAGELQKEFRIAELDSQIEASRERQEALKRLIDTLSQHTK